MDNLVTRRKMLTAAAVAPLALVAKPAKAVCYWDGDAYLCESRSTLSEYATAWAESQRYQKELDARQLITAVRDYGYPPSALGLVEVPSFASIQAGGSLTGGQYADLDDLATWMGVGGGLGTLGGGYLYGSRGMMIGGLAGLGAASAFWLGWNIGTAINIHFGGIATNIFLKLN